MGDSMKKLITVFAALAFCLSMTAQNTSRPSDNQSQSSQPGQSQSTQPGPSQSSQSNQSSQDKQGQRMSGKVSSDAKTFTNDADGKSYTVNNPDALQNYANQHVVIMVQTDPDTGNVTITAVQPPQ